MSASTAIPQIPTSQFLASIAFESVALARQFGLSPSKASVKDVEKVTSVVSKRINPQAFWGPIDFPDGYPAGWQ